MPSKATINLIEREGNFARINRAWEGSTAVCLASGPSITQEQVNRVRHCKVIAVNDCYRLAPWADALYYADARWYVWHKDKPEFKAVTSIRITIENAGGSISDPEAFTLRNLNASQTGYSKDPTGLVTGQNSGYQAIGIAILAGCKRIVLLGYDMKQSAAGKMHFFGDHPSATSPTILRQWRFEYEKMAKALKGSGVEVLNASADTNLEAFTRVKLESLFTDQTATAL